MWKKVGYTQKGEAVYYDTETGKNVTPIKVIGKFQKKIPDYAYAKMGIKIMPK